MASLTQLQYVLAIGKHRHFGKAARDCHVSQPSLSLQVQKLEEEVGFLVFDRQKKPIVPTSKGVEFIEHAKEVMRSYERLIASASQKAGEVSGPFRLGLIPTILPELFPLFASTFSRDFPNVQLSVESLTTQNMIEALKQERLDAGILATPLHEPGLKERVLYYEPFSLYAEKNHALLKKEKINATDLTANELWLLEDGHCLKNQIISFCSVKESKSVIPNLNFQAPSLETLRQLIRYSGGYSLFPFLFISFLSEKEKQLHVREFRNPLPTREVSLVFHREQWKKDILNAIEKTILHSIPKELIEKKQTRLNKILPIHN